MLGFLLPYGYYSQESKSVDPMTCPVSSVFVFHPSRSYSKGIITRRGESMDGRSLSQNIRTKVDELMQLCGSIDEQTASQAPEGRWSPKEILSHLLGASGTGMLAALRAFLDQETPHINVEPGNAHYSDARSVMTFSVLLAQVEKEYRGIADFTDTLTDDQLARKGRIPAFKDSPLGEYLTLGTFISVIGESHLGSHIDHMTEILGLLGAKPSA
jgi:hypothetical protein